MTTPSNKIDLSVTDRLLRYAPGFLPPELFEAVGRIAVYPAVEFIPLRMNSGKIEVLLFERPKDDIIWPHMLHTPGTVLRPTDLTIDDALERLYKDELIGLVTDPPVSLGFYLSKNNRGRCLLLEYLVVVKAEPSTGTFYDVANLPGTFIPEQQASLDRAVAAFVKR